MMNDVADPHLFYWPLRAYPRVRIAVRAPLDDQGFKYRYNAPTHALHLYLYHGQIELAGRRYDLQPGDVTLSPAGGDTAYDLPAPGHHLCIHFDPLPPAAGAASERLALPLHLRLGPRQEEAAHRMMEIAHILAAHSLARQPLAGKSRPPRSEAEALAGAAAGAALQELLLWLAMIHAMLNPPGLPPAPAAPARARIEQAVEQAADWLARHLDRPFSMPALAREVGFSHNYLARHFHARFGVTIPHYLLMRRIELARHLLENTNLPVKSIGARVGLPDPQHFNKQFRRLTGQSPSALRTRRQDPQIL